MVDINQRGPLSSPPDRRLLAQLTQDPKLIRYLENLWTDTTQVGPDNFAIILELVVNAAELANSAQGSSNIDKQDIEELALAIQAMDSSASMLKAIAALISEQSAVVQSPDRAIQALQRKVDELENLMVEFRPPIFPAIQTPTPPFAPTVVTVTTAYAVLAAPPYQPLTVRASAVTAGFTVTLPASPSLLQLVNVKKVDATANIVTVSGGAINIDGAPTVAIGTQYTNLQVQFNGATWDVL